MNNRGRPAGRMTLTRHRQTVLIEYGERINRGERVSPSEMARRVGVHSFRDIKRIVGDLRKMGLIKSPLTRSHEMP